MSYGGSSLAAEITAVNNLVDKGGIVCVAAAGNDDVGGNMIGSPGDADNAIINGDDYWTVLNYAIFESSVEMVRLLIYKGADINIKSDSLHGYTALHCAIYKGHKDIAELLIQRGADVNAGPRTALHIVGQRQYPSWPRHTNLSVQHQAKGRECT